MTYVVAFLSTFIFSIIITPFVRILAKRLGVLDRPERDPDRKIHAEPTPLLGGVAPYASFVIAAVVFASASELLFSSFLTVRQFVGLLVAGGILMVGGFFDDRRGQSPAKQLLAPILAAAIAIAAGFGVTFVTNPFGGVIALDRISWELFRLGGIPYHITLFADLFTFAWLMVFMFTTKFLDGLDGLASGVSIIGSIVLFGLSLSKTVAQPGTALLASLLAGSLAGFLVFNWHPARIFLGQGGSLWVGFMLGLLAIIAGGKIATTLLVLGVPLLDLVWVVLRRFATRRPLATADRKHLHYRLLDLGLSHRQTVVFLYVVTAGFGILGVFANTAGKFWLLIGLFGFMVGLAAWIYRQYRVVHANDRQPPAP